MVDVASKNPSIPAELIGESSKTEPASVVEYFSVEYLERALGSNLWEILTTGISILIILIATIIIARMADRLLKKHIPHIFEASKMDKEFDQTSHALTRRLIVAAIYIIGILMIVLQIPALNRVAVAMLAGAGVAGIAIGFAAQDSLSNIISGILLAVFKPIRIGDYVDFKGEYGHIEDLTLRHTIICTWDLRRIIVPNSQISGDYIVNWSIGSPEAIWPVDFGIAYTSDIDKARNIIIEETKRHPQVMKDEEINVRLTELGDFAVNLRLTFHVASRGDAFDTGCDIREAVKKRFDEEGIEIPYPYQNIVLQRDAA
ncbi:MAG: mechanosensitive ion channel family protein [Methanothrix sp.]|jgi:small-conductance mechanosensitive channel|nr:mechanosensitive ion channel family protein [Methanothrix sp.]